MLYGKKVQGTVNSESIIQMCPTLKIHRNREIWYLLKQKILLLGKTSELEIICIIFNVRRTDWTILYPGQVVSIANIVSYSHCIKSWMNSKYLQLKSKVLAGKKKGSVLEDNQVCCTLYSRVWWKWCLPFFVSASPRKVCG